MDKSTLVVEKHGPKSDGLKETTKEQASLIGRVHLLAYDVVRSLLPQAERYALLKQTEKGFEFLVSNDLGKDVESVIPLRILKTTLQNNSALLMPDALQDQRHGSDDLIKSKKVRSVLCVPIVLPGEQKGLLYVDSLTHAALFSSKDQRDLEGLAERLGRNLQIISKADPETVRFPDDPIEPGNFQRYLGLALFMILVLLLMAAMSYSKSFSRPVDQVPREYAAPDLSTRPFGVSRDLLSLLKDEKLSEAHQILTVHRAKLVSSADLNNLSKELQNEEQAQKPLKVLSEVVHQRDATVIVGQTLQGSPDNLWRLHFSLDGGSWKLASAEGKSFPKRIWGKEKKD